MSLASMEGPTPTYLQPELAWYSGPCHEIFWARIKRLRAVPSYLLLGTGYRIT